MGVRNTSINEPAGTQLTTSTTVTVEVSRFIGGDAVRIPLRTGG